MKLLLLLLSSLIINAPAHAQRRALMEGLQASNNALYVSTGTGNVYVQTAGTMTVKGNAFSIGTSTLVVTGGNVGIGTTNPTQVLYTSGTASNLAAFDSSSSNGAQVSFYNSSTIRGQVGSAKIVGGALADMAVYAVSDLIISAANIRMNTISGTQLYYCTGGTFAGNVGRGAGMICTGGSATALGIYVP